MPISNPKGVSFVQPQPPPTVQPVIANLRYAPHKRDDRRWLVVIAAGLGTTALALGISWFMEWQTKGEFTIMGLYGYGILPLGAFLVGIFAASGYAGVAKMLGIRIRRGLLWGVAGLMVLSYFAMHYIEFRAAGPLVRRGSNQPIGFFTYYDATTRSMRFTSRFNRPKSTPVPFGRQQEEDSSLGGWGYGLRLLEILGFVGGGLVLPAALRGKRYCDLCERYYKTTTLAVIPASVPLKKTLGIFSSGKVKLEGEHLVVGENASETVAQLTSLLNANDVEGFKAKIAELQSGTKAAKSLPRRIELFLSRCQQCGDAVFLSEMQLQADRNIEKSELESIALTPDAADAIQPRKHLTQTT
jgi:hypothetical protein